MRPNSTSFTITVALSLQLAACGNDALPSHNAGGAAPSTAGNGTATAGTSAGNGGAGPGAAGGAGSPGAGGNAGAQGVGGTAANPNGGGGQSAGGSAAGAGGNSSAGSGGGAGSPAGCGTAKICDDFESYAPDTMPGGIWKFLGPDSKYTDSKTTIAVDGSKAFSGKQALHVKAPDSWGGAWIATTVGLPPPNNRMWGRMMLYIHAPKGDNHLDFMRVSTVPMPMDGQPVTRPGYIHYALSSFQEGGNLRFQYMNSFDPDNGEAFSPSQTPTPHDVWTCVEWHFDGSPTGVHGPSLPNAPEPKDELRVWLDGVAHDDMTRKRGTANKCCGQAAKEWTAPPFEMLQLGFIDWPAHRGGATEEVWFDDVVVDSKQIGCPKK